MSRLAREVTTLLLIGLVLAAGATPALADTNLNVGGLAIIANTGGDPIMVRSGPGYQYEVVGHAAEGDIVTVVDGPVAGDDGNPWYKVSTDVLTGYVFADFLVLPENAPAHPQKAQEPQVQAQTLANPSGGGGYTASIAGTGGDGVRLRDGAGTDAAIILVIPEGATVQVLGDPQQAGGSAWYPVSYDGSTGYVVGDYIGSQGSMQAATTVSTAAQAQGFAAGAHVQVSGTGTDDLRIRADAGTDADIVGHAPAGAVLKVLDGPANDDAGNAWYQIDYDGLDGYVAGDFLAWTDAALSSREVVAATAPAAPAPQTSEAAPAAAPKAAAAESAPAPAPKPAAAPAPPPPPPPPPPSNGDAIVAVAMKYVGYPYVWGGTSPGGFDCSGFTYYVIKQVLGTNIGTSTGVQIGVGTPVSAKNLQPGDLVFFQNTYQAGLSHVGIYIGGGQMVHAGSERTGVTISNIWDSYWGPRYYAARRIT
ncbi:MAG TPA: SH3 domain-containing C40 family peptidase [Thermomicrobiales bacterium]|nr:SH3 domain-containing C40 family peptidase [Thermomicrobiales bacterium]